MYIDGYHKPAQTAAQVREHALDVFGCEKCASASAKHFRENPRDGYLIECDRCYIETYDDFGWEKNQNYQHHPC